MITITIKDNITISRNVFEDLADLQTYINSIVSDEEYLLTPEMDEELDKRYEELRTGKVEGIAWNDVKEKYNKRTFK